MGLGVKGKSVYTVFLEQIEKSAWKCLFGANVVDSTGAGGTPPGTASNTVGIAGGANDDLTGTSDLIGADGSNPGANGTTGNVGTGATAGKCGSVATFKRLERALDHVRSHLNHRPYGCKGECQKGESWSVFSLHVLRIRNWLHCD
jgi:hypothetical protein